MKIKFATIVSRRDIQIYYFKSPRNHQNEKKKEFNWIQSLLVANVVKEESDDSIICPKHQI